MMPYGQFFESRGTFATGKPTNVLGLGGNFDAWIFETNFILEERKGIQTFILFDNYATLESFDRTFLLCDVMNGIFSNGVLVMGISRYG